MRLRECFIILFLVGSRVAAQEAGPIAIDPGAITEPRAAGLFGDAPMSTEAPPLSSNRNFSNFIGFLSNPLQNIDPRSLTQVVPIFGSVWASTGPALPEFNGQIYGPAISIAVSDRFSVGLNQGGYAYTQIDRNDRRGPLIDRLRATRGSELGGVRQGFLNLGGFAQYTFIEDVENQFLATAGMRVTVPCGSYEIFQGKGPALLAPYLTVGKEVGNFHLLATGGYQFPARTGDTGTQLFYLNAHLDRQCFGWIYPLVEANWSCHNRSVDITLPTRRGFIDFGNFDYTGNVVSVAAGVNLVLIRDKLELGAVYVRPVNIQGNIDINALIVKMVFRY